MYHVDITADLNDEDETGYIWTFLDEARDPGQIKPSAIVVAGDQDVAAVCEVIDLAPAGGGTLVHLSLLAGLAEDCRALAERALASYPDTSQGRSPEVLWPVFRGETGTPDRPIPGPADRWDLSNAQATLPW